MRVRATGRANAFIVIFESGFPPLATSTVVPPLFPSYSPGGSKSGLYALWKVFELSCPGDKQLLSLPCGLIQGEVQAQSNCLQRGCRNLAGIWRACVAKTSPSGCHHCQIGEGSLSTHTLIWELLL